MKGPKVYLICPVRNATPMQVVAQEEYVGKLERDGYVVHFPPRDVNQANDDGGLRICRAHVNSMMSADEVHVFWDQSSSGCHFDLGMAYMLDALRRAHGGTPIRFVSPEAITTLPEKSFQNVLVDLVDDTYRRGTSVFELQRQGVNIQHLPRKSLRDFLGATPAAVSEAQGQEIRYTGPAAPAPDSDLLERVLAGYKAEAEAEQCLNCTNCKGEGRFKGDYCLPCFLGRMGKDSGEKFLEELDDIAAADAAGLKKAAESYGNSWKRRGGVGAFMMLARKWDRLENRVERLDWDVFQAIAKDDRVEGVIDDVRDLRRYLMLVEAEMVARGFDRQHRDNKAK